MMKHHNASKRFWPWQGFKVDTGDWRILIKENIKIHHIYFDFPCSADNKAQIRKPCGNTSCPTQQTLQGVARLLQTDTEEQEKHSMVSIFFYILNKSGFSKNILNHSTVRFFIAVLNTAVFTGNPRGCRLSIR